MKTICEEALSAIQNGGKVHIDLEKKSMSINGKKVVEGGVILDNRQFSNYPQPANTDDALMHIEDLYAMYAHSIPSENTDRQRRPYFKALPESELSDDDMMFGERRDISQANLECYIMFCVLGHLIIWDAGKMGKWFWQSKSQPNLVILRRWIEQAA